MYVQRFSAFLGLLAIAFGVQARLMVPQARAAAPQVTAFQVDTKASRIYVKVGSATRLGHPHGVEGNLKSGKITLGGDGEFVFDMASFVADTPEARKKAGLGGKVSNSEAKKVTTAMLGNEVLDVAKHPTATFRIASIMPAEKQAAGELGAYQMDGAFTLHGTEKKLQIKANLEKTDKAGVFKLSGTFGIKQTDHGITPLSALGGLSKVADELQITGELVLTPAAPK
jgi:polyisoprenoid-binding protein YceI